jgi:transmembrane 9 superfamily protein 2/4
MPVTWCYATLEKEMYCTTGFPVGCYINEKSEPMGMCMIPVRILFIVHLSIVIAC